MHLYVRQKLLLNLLTAAGGRLAATDLQKLLFLYGEKWETEPSFRFVPYRFGCFSFQSYADRHALLGKGLLEPTENGAWKISAKAEPYVSSAEVRSMQLFVTKTVPERGDALVARVYRESPFYAARSEILDRVIPDAKERRKILAAAPRAVAPGLFTIGYEGDSIDGYLNRLIRNSVRLLCDVRRNPLSRKTGFSKNQLATYCERVGIAYRHMPELGIPGHRRRELNTRKDYELLFEEYEREDLPQAGEAIRELGALIGEYSRIALTCFEKDHEFCHRHCVAEEMQRKIKECPSLQHI